MVAAAENATKPSRSAHFWQGAQSFAPATRNERSEIWTSKSGANMWCFVHFDLEMCFVPHGVHFLDISASKSGRALVWFVHFDFEMCFAPHGVHFFISHLASWLRTRRLSEPTFRLSGGTNHRIKHSVRFATFPPFRASASSFFWLFLFSDLLSSDLSLLSASALLCFSSVNIVGSLTSKLPSTIHIVPIPDSWPVIWKLIEWISIELELGLPNCGCDCGFWLLTGHKKFGSQVSSYSLGRKETPTEGR